MGEKAFRLNLNQVLAILLLVSISINFSLYIQVQNIQFVLREYNARSTLINSDMADMGSYVQQWVTAMSVADTFRNYPYLKSIADNYNKKLPRVRQDLLEYKSFLEANRDLLVSMSINAPMEIKNVENLLDTYEKNVDDFSTYLNGLLPAVDNNTVTGG